MKEINQKQNELIKNVQSKNCHKSYLKLRLEYKNLLEKIAKNYVLNWNFIPLQFEDYLNYLNFYFYKLIKKYAFNSKKTFPSYVKQFLNYEVSNIVRSFSTNNNNIMNKSLTFFEEYTTSKMDLEVDEKDDNEDALKIFFELLENKKITFLEKKILLMLINNYTYDEVAKELNKSKRSIYTLYHRAKTKIIMLYNLQINNNE